MEEDKFYKEINIWKPVDERTVARYRCFEILPNGGFLCNQKIIFMKIPIKFIEKI